MSEGNVEGVKKQEFIEDPPKNEVGSDDSVDDQKDSDNNKNGENPMPSPQQEEEVIKKKYGGLLPRKPPLISKQGAQKPKGPLEALRPKLQPTQQQARSRRSAYAPADDSEADGCNNNASPEDQCATEDVENDNSNTSQDQGCH